MPSELQRVAQGLVQVLNEIPHVVAHLQRTAARCRENAALVGTLAGHHCSAAVAQLDEAARACDTAAHYLSLAPPKALGWAQGLVTMGVAEGSDSTGRNPLALDSGETQPESEPAPYFEHIFKRLPKRPGGQGATSGILTSTDGRGMTHLVSGTRGPGANAPALTGWRAGLAVAREHVEGHAAALLRRSGAPKEATLYLNNKPCPGEAGCDETLEDQLPSGTKLTVYWPGDRKVYRGNGKGMA
ncbi:SCP1.201-like deaminase [Kribbella solani]|uniref:DddA-like double-stranded DNA deaminase toxin n=1 Tax=Kribbella solani TaxID=236067 RepID=UPI0029BF226E|nr:DddA-like double-stranded DNA deaminase toxin [Kribbella solani]MDX3002676.1 SCP1.201-like deaminase [Kribbella solani]